MKVVHVLRKPCSEGTVAANVLRWGAGALNIDATRIGTAADVPSVHAVRQADEMTMKYGKGLRREGDVVAWEPKGGRWPANLVLQHLDGCVQDGTKKVKGQNPQYASDGKGEIGLHVYNRGWGTRPARTGIGHADPDGTETIAAWTCAEGCPVAALDAQSLAGGMHSAGAARDKLCVRNPHDASSYMRLGPVNMRRFGDTGGASRFFKQVKP